MTPAKHIQGSTKGNPWKGITCLGAFNKIRLYVNNMKYPNVARFQIERKCLKGLDDWFLNRC